jgi:hypothetical protein
MSACGAFKAAARRSKFKVQGFLKTAERSDTTTLVTLVILNFSHFYKPSTSRPGFLPLQE